MIDADEWVVEPLSDDPTLPSGFCGGYDRCVNVRTGDAHTTLTVFVQLPEGRKAYLGTYHAPYAHQAYELFLWALRNYLSHDKPVRSTVH